MSLVREIKNLMITSFREPSVLFWSLLFPLLLSSVMMIVLSGIVEKVSIPLAVSPEFPMKEIYEEIPILALSSLAEEDAKKELLEGKLEGYIDGKGELHVTRNSVYSSFLYRIQREIAQTGKLYEKGYTPNFERIIKMEEENTNIMVIFMSAILAMTSVYSYFFGMHTMIVYQANLSTLGLRLAVAPTKKSVQLFAGFVTGMSFNLLFNFITMLYLKYVFNMDFLQDLAGTFSIMLAANFFGMAIGIFIGAGNRFNENTKAMVGTSMGLLFGMTSGMMNDSVKADLLERFPLLMKFNPGNIVSSALYKMNYMGSRDGLYRGILILVAFGLVFYGLSYSALRRRKYDYL